ncbi:MAG TPA: Gldg family protein [Croceibacterium sp.]
MRLDRALAAALLILSSGCRAEPQPPPSDEPPPRAALGLMGPVPIYWGEEAAFGGALSGNATAHWARAQLEAGYTLRPLDTLSDESLADLDFLLLAQPRALGAAENVALDSWIRAGGRLLLFADPMLTGESRFAIGDRRRPQDVILLSPILTRWGLRLQFDEAQPAGFAVLRDAAPIPVNLAGHFALGEGEATCSLGAEGVLARCDVGRGRVIVLADAALLDLYGAHPSSPAALAWLVREGFGTAAGNAPEAGRSTPH